MDGNKQFWAFFTEYIFPFFTKGNDFDPAAITDALNDCDIPKEQRPEIRAKCAAVVIGILKAREVKRERDKAKNA